MLVIFFVALFLRIVILNNYPFLSIGDEVREIGLNGLYLLTGKFNDVFQLGSYRGYSLVPAYLGYAARFIFQYSALTFRLPSAVFGSFAVLFMYISGRAWKGRTFGLIAALLMIANSYHLHFSRTELIINSAGLFGILILLGFIISQKSVYGYFFLGLVFGLSMHMYVAVRPIMVISCLYIFYLQTKNIYKSKKKISTLVKEKLVLTALITIGFLIGLGPTINIPDLLNQTGAGSFIYDNPQFVESSNPEKMSNLFDLYGKGLSTLVYEKTSPAYHYNNPDPLLTFPLNVLFILGFSYLVLSKDKKTFGVLLILLVLLSPLITNVLSGTTAQIQRLSGIFPVCILISAIGLIKLSDIIPNKLKRFFLFMFISILILFSIFTYFWGRKSDPQNIPWVLNDYKFEHVMRYVVENNNYSYYLLGAAGQELTIMHYTDKIYFTTYNRVTVEVVDEAQFIKLLEEIDNNDKSKKFISLELSDDLRKFEGKELKVNCKSQSIFPNYQCPRGFDKESFSYYIFNN